MICPHCNKETDSYTVYGQNANLNLVDNGYAGGVLNYTLTVANAGVANPVVAVPAGTSTLLNVTGCANQGALNTHYHVI